MGHTVRTLRVLVASPSDVQAERDLVPLVTDEVNRWVGTLLGVRLEVVRWETDAYPGFHADGPQGLIDECLKIADADVLVGIFWKRFGSPTKDGTTGTEHEIRQAYEAWQKNGRPQIALYFNQEPHTPASKQETDQWGQVLEFKKQVPSEGLWWQYRGRLEFERLLRNHPLNFVRDNYPVPRETAIPEHSLEIKRLQLLPAAPVRFIGRDDAVRDVKALLWSESSDKSSVKTNRVVILRGLAGVGKSSTAAALAYDPEVRRTFPDGVLWLSLGPTPRLLTSIAAWGRALGSDGLLKCPTLTEAASLLRTLLNTKRALLVVDDLWEAEHVRPFLEARGSQCGLLVTTRETNVAQEIAEGFHPIYLLPVLTSDSAFELLELLAPSVVHEYPRETREIIEDLGCLPLALQVAGHLLAAEAKLGWGVREMLRELRSGSRLLGERAPHDRIGTGETRPTIAALLKQSTDRLDEYTRKCFIYLGAFAPKPATFDLAALRSVWKVDDPRPVVRELVTRGLLEPVGGQFQIHALLLAYARSLLDQSR